MNISFKTICFSLIFALCVSQSTVHAEETTIHAPAKTGIQAMAKEALQKSAAVATFACLGFVAFQLYKALRHGYLAKNIDSKQEEYNNEERNQALVRALVGFCVASTTGLIASADFSSMHLLVNLDLAHIAGLAMRTRKSHQAI